MSILREKKSPQDCIVILGYGVTGKALAKWCAAKKQNFYVVDDHVLPKIDTPFFKGPAFVRDTTLVDGDDQTIAPDFVLGLLVSPGVPPDHASRRWASMTLVPIVSELDLAYDELSNARLIGVTGTNGKSTTVKLIQTLLTQAGHSAGLFGNFGEPLIQAAGGPPLSYYVVELSSFQLEDIQRFRCDINIWMNLTDDHFERYPDLKTYGAAKERLLKFSRPGDIFIYNADDMEVTRAAKRSQISSFGFSLVNPPQDNGAFVNQTDLVIRWQHSEYSFPLSEISLKGLHNQENMLAALLTVISLHHEASDIVSYRNTLKNFCGLPHRVEWVHEENGVNYFDDSKGTNVGAVAMSLAGFEKNVILIAGGRDKMGDYKALKGLVHGKVKTLILLGEAKERINAVLGNETETVLVNDMREAVLIAKKIARPGDSVLLSPACSSFDQYKNYKERGLDFQNWVRHNSNPEG